MKPILTIIFLAMLLFFNSFSQEKNIKRVIPSQITPENLLKINKPLVNDFEKIKSNDSRTTVNKTQLENGFLLIEQISYIWDDIVWVNDWRSSYIYDESNKNTSVDIQKWQSFNWTNSAKYFYTYDGNGNLIEDLYQVWEDSTYVNKVKHLYRYDLNNNQIEHIVQLGQGPTLINIDRESRIFNSSNNLIEYLDQHWYSDAWHNYSRYSCTYDEDNNEIERISQDWNVTHWVNSYRELWTYDFLNYAILYLHQGWRTSSNDWRDFEQVNYLYDINNNLIEYVLQMRNDSDWVILSRHLFTYDLNNNRTELAYQIWQNFVWTNFDDYLYTYDENNNLTESFRQLWSDSIWINYWDYFNAYDGNNNQIEQLYLTWSGTEWINVNKRLLKYIPLTAIDDDINSNKSYSLSNNYPNPFNPSTRIQYAISSRQFVTLKVFDVLGTEIETLVNEEKSAGKYELNWNAANLPSGVYFYRLQAGSFVQTRKMILLK